MQALLAGREKASAPNLREWLRNGEASLSRLRTEKDSSFPAGLSPVNALSRLNVLEQLDHLRGYPPVASRMREGKLALHGWWFDIAEADVYTHDAASGKFVLLGEE
jgi:carbonic anhydrase